MTEEVERLKMEIVMLKSEIRVLQYANLAMDTTIAPNVGGVCHLCGRVGHWGEMCRFKIDKNGGLVRRASDI